MRRLLDFGENKDFKKTNKRMARMVAIGGGTLALTFAIFVSVLWENKINTFEIFSLPLIYLIIWGISYIKLSAKQLYNILLIAFIYSTYILTHVGYILNFDARYSVLMIATINIILLVLASRRQLRIYFLSIFIPGTVALFMADVEMTFRLIIITMFMFGVVLSYIITSQRNNLLKKLRSNDNILKALLQSTNESIFLVSYYSKKIIDVNKKAVEEFGYQKAEELIGKDYTKTIFSNYDDMLQQRTEIKKQINSRGFFETEILLTRKSGEKFWGLLTLIPFEAENDNFYLLQIRNIDDKKKIEQKLQENNHWFNLIMNNIDEFIYVYEYIPDGKDKFVYVSPYIQKIFGINQNDIISESIREQLDANYHPDDIEKIKVNRDKFKTNKRQPVEVEYRFKPIGQDDYILIKEKVIPILNENGEIHYALGILSKAGPEN